jgi:hypothetical protein
MIILPIIGSIKGASKLAAANPIRLPECLAIRVHTANAIIMARNMIPNVSLKCTAPLPQELSLTKVLHFA